MFSIYVSTNNYYYISKLMCAHVDKFCISFSRLRFFRPYHYLYNQDCILTPKGSFSLFYVFLMYMDIR